MKLLKKLYDKSELTFTIIWIVLYIVLMSLGDNFSSMIGIEKLISVFISLLLSIILIFFLKKNNLFKTYGLCKPSQQSKKLLFYIPCLILLTANLWFGVRMNYNPLETVLYILTMFCVGFLEEMIFRGLLFNTMKKDNLVVAILVSSLTFGIGHIVNLFNGSGADLLANILQVIYATSAGFMFVMLYHKTDSIIICILVHAIFNSLSAFCIDAPTIELEILSCILLTLITGLYAIYLALIKKTEDNKQINEQCNN